MNVPTLPTLPSDNLYKFMTVLGIALMVAGTLGPYPLARQSRLDDLEQRKVELGQIDKLSREQEVFRRNLEDLMRLPPAELPTEVAINFYKARTESVNSQNVLMKMRTAQLGEIMQVRPDLQFTDLKKAKYLVWGGIAMTIAGFSLWWFRFQRYQDRIVRAEADKVDAAKRISRPVIG